MPADQASRIFMAQDAHASWAKGCQSCTQAGHHCHLMGSLTSNLPDRGTDRVENSLGNKQQLPQPIWCWGHPGAKGQAAHLESLCCQAAPGARPEIVRQHVRHRQHNIVD